MAQPVAKRRKTALSLDKGRDAGSPSCLGFKAFDLRTHGLSGGAEVILHTIPAHIEKGISEPLKKDPMKLIEGVDPIWGLVGSVWPGKDDNGATSLGVNAIDAIQDSMSEMTERTWKDNQETARSESVVNLRPSSRGCAYRVSLGLMYFPRRVCAMTCSCAWKAKAIVTAVN
jgi:hypothetical protein